MSDQFLGLWFEYSDFIRLRRTRSSFTSPGLFLTSEYSAESVRRIHSLAVDVSLYDQFELMFRKAR